MIQGNTTQIPQIYYNTQGDPVVIGANATGNVTTREPKVGPTITVATAGTAVQGANIAGITGVIIVADGDNGGSIYVGGVGVTNGSGGQQGAELAAKGSITLYVTNLNQIWVNADSNGYKAGTILI